MASLRKPRPRADGTTAYSVLYSFNNQQTSLTFDTHAEAVEFRDAVNTLGAERAMRAWNVAPTKKVARKVAGTTVQEWVESYIKSRTGVAKSTLWDYNSYLRNDISGSLGPIPLTLLSRDDIAEWVQDLAEDSSGKTVSNKHGFLSAALNAAVKAGKIPNNPAAGTRLPRTERPEMVFLTHEEFAIFREGFMPRWRPMVDFMVVSGMRFGELVALRPDDIDRKRGTVHVARAWKRTYDKGGYEIGAPKTRKSVRTINIAHDILAALDYSNEWLFVNTAGTPIRAPSFRNNVWYPSRDRAAVKGLEKRPRMHDMRHTCASWMVQAGVPLPVVQAHLGHENINTTISLYAHIDRASSERAAAAVRLGLGKPSTES